MDGILSFFSGIWEWICGVAAPIWTWVEGTGIPEQIAEVDMGLFTNPWFLLPFLTFVLYKVYKKQWRNLVILTVVLIIWWLSGTEYMKTLVIGDELQIDKVLPVVGIGVVAVGLVIYLIFGRSD
jgi:hypothetical protein